MTTSEKAQPPHRRPHNVRRAAAIVAVKAARKQGKTPEPWIVELAESPRRPGY